MGAQLKIADFFCGCGGFSLGAHKAGLTPSVSFDIDPILTSSYSFNFPSTKLALADLSKLRGKDVRRLTDGPVHGLFGGPPCQAFSDIGHRRKDDPRRDLLRHFFRLVAELQPTFFVMENVRGLGYSDARPYLDRCINQVPSRYEIIGPILLDAADYGGATRRPRLFIIGYDPAYCDPIAPSDLEQLRRKPASVGEAISDLQNASLLGEADGFDIWRIVQRGRPSAYASRLRSEDRVFTGHKRTAHTAAVVKRFSKVKQGEVEAIGRHPRLAEDGQCPTLRAGTGSDRGSYQSVRPIHPTESRVITVREAARLQGFPDSFRFHPTVWHSFRMIGNSVSPIISRAIFSMIAEKIGVEQSLSIAAE